MRGNGGGCFGLVVVLLVLIFLAMVAIGQVMQAALEVAP
jgi:hypothetical protein